MIVRRASTDAEWPGAVLAGGASRRFGSPKAAATLEGPTLLERVGEALRAAGVYPVVIGGDPALAAEAGYAWSPDPGGGAGPLRGLVGALRYAAEREAPGCLCVACDMPFLAADLLRRLVDVALSSGATAVAPASGRNPRGEPLCTWYSTRALREAEARLASGTGRMRDCLAALDPIILPVNEVRAYGPDDRLFLNINTPSDLRRARSEAIISSALSDGG